MTYPYNEPLFSNFLMVRMTIEQKNFPKFKTHMQQVIKGVFDDKLDWKLVRTGRRQQPGDPKAFELLHLAQMPEPANLWEGMYSVAADSSFARASKLVTHESQELLRLAPLSPIKLGSSTPRFFALSELELKQDWANLCKWRERLLSLNCEKKTGPKGWPLYATFRPQTGNLRRQINIWQIDASQTQDARNWEKSTDRTSDKLADGTKVVETRHPIAVYETIQY